MDDPDKMIASLMSMQDSLLAMLTPAYVIGVTLFSVIGIVAYLHGKKRSLRYPKRLGIALMLYPYVVWQTWMIYAVGIGLCVALYFLHDK